MFYVLKWRKRRSNEGGRKDFFFFEGGGELSNNGMCGVFLGVSSDTLLIMVQVIHIQLGGRGSIVLDSFK